MCVCEGDARVQVRFFFSNLFYGHVLDFTGTRKGWLSSSPLPTLPLPFPSCKNKMVTKQVAPGMFQQYTQQVGARPSFRSFLLGSGGWG